MVSVSCEGRFSCEYVKRWRMTSLLSEYLRKGFTHKFLGVCFCCELSPLSTVRTVSIKVLNLPRSSTDFTRYASMSTFILLSIVAGKHLEGAVAAAFLVGRRVIRNSSCNTFMQVVSVDSSTGCFTYLSRSSALCMNGLFLLL